MSTGPAVVDSAPMIDEHYRALTTIAELRDITDIVLHAGHLLLENGAETWRIEDTIHRLGCDLGAERMETYPTPTGIIVSAMEGGVHSTRIVRVTSLGVNLSRVTAVLDMTRRADRGGLTRASAHAELERIAGLPRAYPTWLTVVAMAFASACYAALQGGGGSEFVVGLLAAATTSLIRAGLDAFFGKRVLLSVAVSAFLGVTVALLGLQVLPIERHELVVVAAVLSLLPGVAMINSIADLINGNYISGLARAAQAALILAAVATGMVTSAAVFHGSLTL